MIQFIIAQATTGDDSAWMSQLLLFGGIILVFYFFMIRPQQKKQKDQKKFIAEIKKGDSVVTIGGLHGKVFQVEEDKIILEIDKGTKMIFEKSAVSLEQSKKLQEK
ncbi:preprotein translocase subunit YajC [Marivirga harenae]|uniref:preprotein translocase subunit YajC n=1 Tax=Marivirga harenae TaxID=2010992 RepID=UPI0026DF443C|nr:preprotein translocase subunit YajC [Marivirga harenae]WKV12866.1 preprotein translocase subunit YajC [Marivirga harenae]|tara:strand:- start:10154 stop:10471 length:318 start_codon:yes stop_codon:yes gene_type:complete